LGVDHLNALSDAGRDKCAYQSPLPYCHPYSLAAGQRYHLKFINDRRMST